MNYTSEKFFVRDLTNNKYINIIGCTSEEKEITIPSHINGVEVKSIGEYAIDDSNNYKKINIPSSITKLCDYAIFTENLEEVNIEGSNRKNLEIGKFAFSNNYKLHNINIGFRKNILIKERAFEHCESLESFILKGYNITIEAGCFNYCKKLKSIKIVANNLIIKGKDAFYDLENLTSVSFTGLKYFDNILIKNCPKLKELRIGASPYLEKKNEEIEIQTDYLNKMNHKLLRLRHQVKNVVYEFLPVSCELKDKFNKLGMGLETIYY